MPSDFVNLWIRLCTCAGTRQPSRTNPQTDEHLKECPYRLRVEAEVGTTITERDSDEEKQHA